MDKTGRVFVAGHNGMVGSALMRAMQCQGFSRIITAGRQALDLRDAKKVESFFERERPGFVILVAAKVGGIQANRQFPAEFLYDNLAIQTNVIHEAYRSSVKRLLFLGSSRIYPKLRSAAAERGGD